MTQREREILNWIAENPLISQQELADKAGITRSSAAVHISNLMKKGYIVGKGYILRSAPYAVVIGGVRSISAAAPTSWWHRTPTPGRSVMSLGGVGRNIAHNMTLLGADVRMLTAFGDDLHGQKIAASCGSWASTSPTLFRSPGRPPPLTSSSPTRQGNGLAVSDMEIYAHVTPSYLSSQLGLLHNAQLIVFDTNIPAETIACLAENCPGPSLLRPGLHRQGGKAPPGTGQAPHPQAQPHRGGTALRRPHHRRGQP